MKKKTIIFLLIFILFPLKAYCLPVYLDIFNKDPFARPEKKNKCSLCHVSPNGGGPLNDFGKAFDANGKKIANDLRQKFPELFDLLKALEPKIIRVKPVALIAGKETKVMIIGNNFASDSIVKIDGESINEESGIKITFVSSTRIDVTVTFNQIGRHSFQIENATGQTSNTFKIKVKGKKLNRSHIGLISPKKGWNHYETIS